MMMMISNNISITFHIQWLTCWHRCLQWFSLKFLKPFFSVWLDSSFCQQAAFDIDHLGQTYCPVISPIGRSDVTLAFWAANINGFVSCYQLSNLKCSYIPKHVSIKRQCWSTHLKYHPCDHTCAANQNKLWLSELDSKTGPSQLLEKVMLSSHSRWWTWESACNLSEHCISHDDLKSRKPF